MKDMGKEKVFNKVYWRGREKHSFLASEGSNEPKNLRENGRFHVRATTPGVGTSSPTIKA
jgi:hypothetical protein